MSCFANLKKIIPVSAVLISSLCLAQNHGTHTDSDAPTSRPVADRPSEVDLQMYLEILDAREKTLKAVNQAILTEADYSLIKIPLFMAKAALDGYFFGRILGVGGTAASAGTAANSALSVGAKSFSQRAAEWLTSGGLERLKSLGFNVGIIGVSAANNTLLLPGYRWQYGVPIYGTAYAAYLWSDQLHRASDLIEQNGNEIIKIRKEKARVRSALENLR